MIRLVMCPICKDNPLSCDKKRFTISCRSCHLDWILSKRIQKTPSGILRLISSAESREVISQLQSFTNVGVNQ